ncbi:MAG: hypothetical protein A2084_00240 [Tenericutes bacterium GWC2_39_45]|nr:MAG: hypothetical protein A2084_00240 [Tenericutes bacterium GWC2_39_45]OHE40207.1 MAG: hypothetical protein A2013_04710 [Tenericutes bacterium GWE2_38_8]HCB66342.1 hypothetical protein [Acholeplasmataceae bacterium]
MIRLIKLLKVEFAKVFTKYFILFAFVSCMIVILFSADNLNNQVETSPRDEYWMSELQDEIINIDMYISDNPDLDSNALDELIKIKQINMYRIENNLQPTKDKSISGLLKYNNILYMMIIISSLVVSTRIITDEFKNDSIKMLATYPYSRKEILTTKYIVVIITPVLFLASLLFFVVLIGGLYFGFKDLNSTFVDYIDGSIITELNLVHLVKQWGQQSFSLIAISSLAVFLGILFKNALLSILTSVLSYILGTYITVFLVNYDWIKFTIFPHLNYYLYTYDNIDIPEFSSAFSYLIILFYLTIFVLGSYIVFEKKEL